mmetsp:Transcript_14421/g.25941  ORF Transcript_14421/g.25941 Transcript_14421/m.25941 type:complete len:92 (-) Transcript_14421:133-408(-)
MIHNIFASLVPQDLKFDIYDPTLLIPAVSTIVIHLYLAKMALEAVRAKNGFKYIVVDGLTEAADRLPAFLKQEEEEKKMRIKSDDDKKKDR